MAQYTGAVLTLDPVTTDDNWTLDAAIDEYGEIVSLQAAGEETAGAAVVSRVSRSASAAGTGTAGNTQLGHPHSNAALIAFFTTYMTTQPTLSAGAIVILAFNVNGGSVFIITDPNARPQIVGAETVSCRNSVGTGTGATSNYSTTWKEP
jgi:hypothetical protein